MPNITFNTPEIQAVIQQGILVREFFEPLFPRLLYRAEAGTPHGWPGNVGESMTFTADGEIDPTQESLDPMSDPGEVTYPREQWDATLKLYPKDGKMETHMVSSANAIVSLLMRNAKKQGLQAGRSLDLMCRTAIVNPGAAGATVADGAQAAVTNLKVKRLNGFTRARRPDIAKGSPVKYDFVTANNPLQIQVISGGVATQVNVIAYSSVVLGDEVGPGTLTLDAPVTCLDRDPVVAINGTWQWHAGNGARQGFNNPGSIDTIGPGNTMHLSDLRGVFSRFHDTGNGTSVPVFPEGYYHCHMAPNIHAQLFSDAEMQRMETAILQVPDHYLFKKQLLSVALGFLILNDALVPKKNTVTGHGGGLNTFSPKDPLGLETVNKAGVGISYTVFVGEGGLNEYYQATDLYLSDAGVTGIIGEFSNLDNDGVQVTTQGVSFIMRSAMNVMMDRVTTTWKWVGDHVFRPDGIMGDLSRFKRCALLAAADV